MSSNVAPKIRPLGDRIVVEPKLESKSAGGIVIPDTAEGKPMEGTVIAIGSGRYLDGKILPLQVKVGERILFGKYSGTNVKLDNNKEYLVMREEDVMGVLD